VVPERSRAYDRPAPAPRPRTDRRPAAGARTRRPWARRRARSQTRLPRRPSQRSATAEEAATPTRPAKGSQRSLRSQTRPASQSASARAEVRTQRAALGPEKSYGEKVPSAMVRSERRATRASWLCARLRLTGNGASRLCCGGSRICVRHPAGRVSSSAIQQVRRHGLRAPPFASPTSRYGRARLRSVGVPISFHAECTYSVAVLTACLAHSVRSTAPQAQQQ